MCLAINAIVLLTDKIAYGNKIRNSMTRIIDT